MVRHPKNDTLVLALVGQMYPQLLTFLRMTSGLEPTMLH